MLHKNTILIILLGLSIEAFSSTRTNFLNSFDGMPSTCDKIEIKKSYDGDEAIVKIVLHDLAELGNEEFTSGVPLKKFEFEDSRTLVAKRFSRYDGVRVKEVYTFKKDENNKTSLVQLKRFKRSLVRYTYPLGGIVCRFQAPIFE